jgi:hypothetical protein
MRAIRICTVGGIVAGVAFGVSQITSGLVGGAAFILALYIVPVTVGLALAVGVEACTNRSRSSAAEVTDTNRGAGSLQRVWATRILLGDCFLRSMT